MLQVYHHANIRSSNMKKEQHDYLLARQVYLQKCKLFGTDERIFYLWK